MAEPEKGFFTPGGSGLFSWFANEPVSHQTLERRRKIAQAMAAQKKGMPKNVGEGLTYLGESIGEAGYNWRLEAAERAAEAQYQRDAAKELGGATTAPPPAAAAPGPRAAIAPDPAVAETVAAAEEEPGATTVAYAPEAPRDPPPALATPVSAPRPGVLPPPARPAPQQVQQAPQPYFGGDPMSAPMARGVPSSMLSGQNVYQPPLSGGAATAQPAAHLVGQGRQAVGMPDQAVMESGLRKLGAQRLAETGGNALFDPNPAVPPPAEKVYAENELSPLDEAAPNVVADVPVPRARPEQVAASGPTFRTERNAEVGQRVGFDRAVSGLHPEMQARLMAAYNDMPPDIQKTFVLNEGFRTRDYQQYLYDTRSGRGMVAKTHSKHEDGTAVDADRTPALDWLQKNGRQYGLTGIKGDYPHIQMAKGGRQFFDPANPVALNAPGGGNVAVANGGYNQIDAQAGGGPQVASRDPRAAVTDAILAGGQAPPEAAQVARTQDVLGMGGQSTPQPRTASLGRAGVVSDAVPLGLNPTGSGVDAGVAAAVQQRNAITNQLLQQEQKIPVREEPVVDPTQAGLTAPATSTTSSSLPAATGSPTSPSPLQFAQAPPPANGRPPTVSDVRPAPAQGLPPVPGPFDVNKPDPPPPQAGRIEYPPGIGARPEYPDPPKPLPLTPEEIRARQIILQHPGDPNYAALAAQVAQPGLARRTAADAHANELYKNKLATTEKQILAWDEAYRKWPETKLGLEKSEREAQQQTQQNALAKSFGNLPVAEVLKPIQESQKTVAKVPLAQSSVRNVMSLLESDKTMFTGAGAETETTIAKLAKLMNMPVDPRVVNAESFKAYIANIVAQNRQMLAGNANISDPDMKAAVEASGGSINLERDSIMRIMRGIEKSNTLAVANHNRMLAGLAGDNPDLQKTLFGQYGVNMQDVVPREAVTRLQRLAADPAKAERAIKEFDRTFFYPGLAQQFLTGR